MLAVERVEGEDEQDVAERRADELIEEDLLEYGEHAARRKASIQHTVPVVTERTGEQAHTCHLGRARPVVRLPVLLLLRFFLHT